MNQKLKFFWTRLITIPICAAAIVLLLLFPYIAASYSPSTEIQSYGHPNDAFADLTIYVSNPTRDVFSFYFSFNLWVMENSTKSIDLTIFYFGENFFPDGVRAPFLALRHDEGVHYNISGVYYGLWTYDYKFNRTIDVARPERFPLDVYESETFYIWLNETIYPYVFLRATPQEGFCVSIVDKGLENCTTAYQSFPKVQQQIFGKPQIDPLHFQIRMQRDFSSLLLFCIYLGFVMYMMWGLANFCGFIKNRIETEIQVFATMSISVIAFIWTIRQFVSVITQVELIIIAEMFGWFIYMTYSNTKGEKTSVGTDKAKQREKQYNEKKNSSHEYEEYIKKLIKLVDENFKPIRLRDIFKASEMFQATIIVIIVLYVYILVLTPFTPISVQIPWALSFAAILLATASFMQASRKTLGRRLVNQQFRRIYPLQEDQREETKLFLVALLTMKIENPSFKLSTIYEVDDRLFEKEKLLDNLYE
jgi:hypothetical protein